MPLYLLFSFFISLCKSADDINCDISKGPVIINSKSLVCDSLSSRNFGKNQKIVISGTSSNNYINVTNSDAILYFKNLNVNYESAVSISGGNVKILFEGTNIIASGDNAGIKCYNQAKLTFSNGTRDDTHQSCILKASSSSYTGIGVDYEVSNCSELTFLGGRIEATGGIWGAGIGTGLGSDKYGGNVDLIKIVSGSIQAVGGRYAAGIGCGRGQAAYSSNVKRIEIYGGSVSGQSSEYGAGIGAGFGNGDNSASVASLFVYGGEVNGKGGLYGSGVGGGYGFGSNSAFINEITLSGNYKVENTKSDFTSCTSLVANGGDRSEKGVGNGLYGKVNKINTNTANLNCNAKYCDFKAESNCARPWLCSPSIPSNCPQCAPKYELISGQCVSVTEGGEGCIEHTEEGVCLKCESGYELKDGACYSCQNVDHCSEYNDKCECTHCENPYYLSDGMCIRCDIQNCAEVTQGCKCLRCETGYYLSNGVCRVCDIKNCAAVSNECTCLQCQIGYQLRDGFCYSCQADSHCLEFGNNCYCTRCEDPYYLIEGVCSLCNVPYCSNINDDCTCQKCKNGYFIETPYVCRSCGISHCSHFVNGCECAVCDSGYFLENGRCSACNVPHCDTFENVDNSCTCSLCIEGYKDFNGVCHKIRDTYENIPSFVYCPSEEDFRCAEYSSDWEFKKEFLIQAVKEIINDKTDSSNPTERSKNLAYRLAVEDIRNSDHPINAKQNINAQLKSLRSKKEKIIIYQFGSMGPDASYDFSVLNKVYDVVVICLDHLIYGSGSSINIKSGNLKKVRSLTCYLGEVAISKGTLKVENLALVAAPIYGPASIESDYLLFDSYSLDSLNYLSKPKVNNFAVIFPERNNWNAMTFNNQKQIEVQPGPYPAVTVPTDLGKKQTAIIGYANDILLKAEDLKEVKNEINISVRSAGEPVHVEFAGNEWKSVKMSKGLVIESDSPDDISVTGKPKKGKISATQRFDDTKEYPKKSKLSRGAIAGIVVAILVVIAVIVWLIVFLCCVQRPEEQTTHEEKSMKTTNELFQPVFQDDN